MDFLLCNCPVILARSGKPKLVLKLILPCLGEGKLHQSEPEDSCRHCFPVVLNLVQVDSWGGIPYAKGAVPGFVRQWIPVNGTHNVVSGHMISIGTLSSL